MGKAYGFFKCDASLEKIEAEIPVIRRVSEIPDLVQLSFMKAEDAHYSTPKIMEFLEESIKHGWNYHVRAFYPSVPPEKTADELVLVMQGVLFFILIMGNGRFGINQPKA
ncbi:MAG TPA: hypothetical protein VJJ21_02930 [Candidatus Nanoarchaeia archaeon]|nr:hypothetical protein [Candidatus Nanoarchaeia archaeon]